MPREDRDAQGIPLGTLAVNNVRAKRLKTSKNVMRNAAPGSGMAARTIGWNESIRQKVIGRTMAAWRSSLGWCRFFHRSVHGEFPLLDKPASETGGGVFLEPLIEQGSDFLAQTGGVGQTGEFVGLERIAGAGEQEFPGCLGAGLRHNNLQSRTVQEYGVHNNRIVIHESSAVGGDGLWKCVEKQGNSAGCCSGCAGDYEDPDRTIWEADPEEDEELGGGGGGVEEGDRAGE